MKTRRSLLLMLLVTGIVSLGITRNSWLPLVGTCLDIGEPLHAAQCVFILPGSEETRPFVAAGLIRAGYADIALIPETRANPDIIQGITSATSETTRQILLKRGISPSKIVMLPGSSDSTFGDAQALSRYLEESEVADVLIVTNAYHSRRARWVFRQVLPSHCDRLRFYSAPNGFDARIWWTSRAGRQAVISEWIKFLFYLMYYGRGWLWCLIVAVIGGTVRLRCRQMRTLGVKHVGVWTTSEP